jgi:hypothetical protein
MFLKAVGALLLVLVFTLAGLLGITTTCITQFQTLPNLSGMHFITCHLLPLVNEL